MGICTDLTRESARDSNGTLHGTHMGLHMGLHMGPHTGLQMQGGAYGSETCGKPFHKSLFFR
jgi:hypothetical protein